MKSIGGPYRIVITEGKGPLSETSVSNPLDFFPFFGAPRRSIGCSSDVAACRVDSLANESAKRKTRKKGERSENEREGASVVGAAGREKRREAVRRVGPGEEEEGQKGRLKTSIVTAANKL